MHREEGLGLARRSEAAQCSLPFPRWLVRKLGTVVRILLRAVHRVRRRLALRGRVASQLVGGEPARRATLPFPQRAEEPRGGPAVPPALDEEVEGVAVLIQAAPEVDALATDRDQYLVEKPGVAEATHTCLQRAGVCPSELRAPLPDGFVGDAGSPLGQQVLDVTKAQAEAMYSQTAWLMLWGG
jgi:hypothetical protein